MAGESESGGRVRSWRTAFLTLRDETLSHPANPLASVLPMLDGLMFSQFQSFIAAAPYLPRQEVTSDLMYLLNLAASSLCSYEEMEQALCRICHLIWNVTRRVPLELSSSASSQMLESFSKLGKFFIETAVGKRLLSDNSLAIKATIECLETLRHLISVDPQRCSVTENAQLVEFLLQIIMCCHSEANGSHHSAGDLRCCGDSGKRSASWTCLWKVQTAAFYMVGEAFARVGPSLTVEIWKSVVEVLRKVMDTLATKMFLVEDVLLSRFYASVLHCLHLVLINRKGSLSDHVAAFIASLRMFLHYGLSNSGALPFHHDSGLGSLSHGSTSRETFTKAVGTYRPPHLRQGKNSSITRSRTSQTSSDHESSPVEFSSSDSDYSDSDGALKDSDNLRSCKTRTAALTCIQDLCEADPKAFIAQWAMLLPTNDVLHPRKHEATLMTCLLFDPFMKARLASASTIAAMLEGQSSVALQVAEYREGTKFGSYMALSSCLGQILMELHTGVLHLIQRERHTGLLTSSFRILLLLISSTPYSRMPGELLPRVLQSLRLRIEEGFPFKNDQTSLLAIAINCLTAAVSTSPSSLHVHEMFRAEISTGLSLGQGVSGVLVTLFQLAQQVSNLAISLETLQALKALCHNYPSVMASCWKQISPVVYQFLKLEAFRVPSGKGAVVHDGGSTVEKVVAAAVKVMDECLRAVSGFKGTEDLFGDRLMEIPFASDCIRDKKVSSAPSYGLEALKVSEDNLAGSLEWREAIEKHIAFSLCHPSGMVRAASITCFAGMTCSVFFSLEEQQQQFVLSSCINAANDLVPSVRSAACRAIGVIACFPEILQSPEILQKFIKCIEANTRDQLVSVRITASWAMANMCDSFCHSLSDSSLDLETNFHLVEFLLDCVLHLTRDGDKIKSNAVRALGNLSRVIPFADPLRQGNFAVTFPGTSNTDAFLERSSGMESSATQSTLFDSLGSKHLLERIVQAFLSCITTGNVKVQWNACHALSNLFLNESLRTQQMDWASSIYSVLLLLLRDSSNFKIRIQAAAALAVPSTVLDYGRSFSDVVRGIEQNLENLVADRDSNTSYKYRIALEKQVTASMLHVLVLCSSSSNEPLKEFLVKKAPFFEGWLKNLCSSLETSTHEGCGVDAYRNQKRDLVSKAMQSLIHVYETKNLSSSAEKLQKMLEELG